MGSGESRASKAGATKDATATSSAAPGGSVNVEIRGQRLAIKSDRDPAFVEQLADYIDEKVQTLQASAPGAPFDKLMMLASLNVAAELFESREEVAELRRHLKERTQSMLRLLDQVDP